MEIPEKLRREVDKKVFMKIPVAKKGLKTVGGLKARAAGYITVYDSPIG
jgi:transaldolase